VFIQHVIVFESVERFVNRTIGVVWNLGLLQQHKQETCTCSSGFVGVYLTENLEECSDLQ